MRKLLTLGVLSALLLSLSAHANVPTLTFDILEKRTHKSSTFTQGLEIFQGDFYESSGLYGQSFIARYPVEESGSQWARISAPFSDKQKLADRFFAEGLTRVDDKLYVLTWKEQTLHIYNLNPLTLHKQLSYTGEGWGLAYDGENLLRSDGSHRIHIHRKHDFSPLKSIDITLNGTPYDKLNELEYHDGFIWANRWYFNEIAKIDPKTGEVIGLIDVSNLAAQQTQSSDVLNGIAWDDTRNGFWITGKRWPSMYLIRLHDSLTETSSTTSARNNTKH